MSERKYDYPIKRSDKELLDGLEERVNTGSCPGVINDDNGHWAVTDDGMQDVSWGDSPMSIATTFFVEAARWKDTVRQAIDAYLDYEGCDDG